MAMEGIAASLVIYGRTEDATAAEVTRTLGIEPSESLEPGEKREHQRGPARDYSIWSLDVVPAEDEDEHFLGTLSRLLDLLSGKVDALASLTGRYDVRLQWASSSDGSQGAFSMPAELLAKLGPLGSAGVYLWGTVHLVEDD